MVYLSTRSTKISLFRVSMPFNQQFTSIDYFNNIAKFTKVNKYFFRTSRSPFLCWLDMYTNQPRTNNTSVYRCIWKNKTQHIDIVSEISDCDKSIHKTRMGVELLKFCETFTFILCFNVTGWNPVNKRSKRLRYNRGAVYAGLCT